MVAGVGQLGEGRQHDPLLAEPLDGAVRGVGVDHLAASPSWSIAGVGEVRSQVGSVAVTLPVWSARPLAHS